jgi:CRISPR-associated endonuclease Csn1
MKKVLGLDIGTNSIGWAYVNLNQDVFEGNIVGMGVRIIPMDMDLLNNLEQGNSISKTASRRQIRGARRLKQRFKLRRDRLIKTLKIAGWISEDFKVGSRIPYSNKVLEELRSYFNTKDISDDWAVYYLRKKGLTQKIELMELARILLHINQRRGFKSNRKANKSEKSWDDLMIKNVCVKLKVNRLGNIQGIQ